MNKTNLPPCLARLFLPLLAFVLFTLKASGQNDPTASREADLAVFGGYSRVTPDYGPDSVKDHGLTYGVDYIRYFQRWPVIPALEFRSTSVSGSTVNEHTLNGGIRVHRLVLPRVRAYADLLAGSGSLHYNVNVTSPTSAFVYTVGGGADIFLVHDVWLKLDGQMQFWKGPDVANLPPPGQFTLSASAITLGVFYRIPFKSKLHD